MKTILAVVVAGLLCGCASVGNLVLGALPGGSTVLAIADNNTARARAGRDVQGSGFINAAQDTPATFWGSIGADLAKGTADWLGYQAYQRSQNNASDGPAETPGAAPAGIDVAGDFYWVTAGRDSEIHGRAGE